MKALGDFEHLESPDKAAGKRMLKDIFDKRRVNLLIAKSGKKPIGYALYFYTYSTFLGKPTLYLEDIFVLEDFRKKGAGKKLFMKCIDEALKKDCGRLEFAVLTWNKNAMKFYEKLGARRMNEWYSYRLTRDAMEKAAGRNQPIQ